MIETHETPRRIPVETELFRWGALAASVGGIVLQFPLLQTTTPIAFAALFLTILAARIVPVAVAREKPITFSAAFIFAGALLMNGPAAGLAVLLACAIQGRFFQKGGRAYAIFLGAQFALATMASHSVFAAITGHDNVDRAAAGDLAAIFWAGAAFIAVNSLLTAIGNIGTRYAERSHAEPLLRAYAFSYGVSFPFAVLLISTCGAYGAGAIPVLAAVLLVCAHAVRMTIENRSLRRTLDAVENLGRSCAAQVRQEEPLERFLDLARDLVAYDFAVLWLVEESTGALSPRVIAPRDATLPEPPNPRLDALLTRVTPRAEPLLIAHAARSEELPSALLGTLPEADESWVLHPIMLHGNCIGAAQLVRSARRPFVRADLERLGALAPQAAVAFEGVRVRYLMHQYQEMMERYQDMAQTDGLTGLYNHRRSQELLRDEVARASRYHHPLSALMVDVDFFKQYNDSYGHPQGDVLLRSIAHILKAGVRTTDHVGRYGGEEFILVLPETTGSDAYILAERLRRVIEEAWFPAQEGWVVQKTVSIGVAAFPLDAVSAAEMLQKADAALYRAKQTGKNRVEMAEHRTPGAPAPRETREARA